jgi:heme a synthase
MTSLASLSRGWFTFLGYTVLVAVFGTVVRITGSGAGCGQHWPTCHGDVVHLPRSMETAIELTHRVTSGAAGILCLVLVYFTWRLTFPGHAARKWALVSLALLIIEGLIGRYLVVLSLVGQNASPLRAFVMGAHLVNTSFLLTAILLTAWTLSERGAQKWALGARLGKPAWRALFGAFLLLVVSAAGAVTALGDTIYPVANEMSRGAVLLETVDAKAHFLERMRGFHPILAVLVSSFLLYVAADAEVRRIRVTLLSLIALQLGLGVLNVALGAPGWMQVVHLTAATVLWLGWSEFSLNALFRASCVRDGVASSSAE